VVCGVVVRAAVQGEKAGKRESVRCEGEMRERRERERNVRRNKRESKKREKRLRLHVGVWSFREKGIYRQKTMLITTIEVTAITLIVVLIINR